MKISVVIVDDSEITRSMLEEILQQDEEIEVIGTADDGSAAISVGNLPEGTWLLQVNTSLIKFIKQ